MQIFTSAQLVERQITCTCCSIFPRLGQSLTSFASSRPARIRRQTTKFCWQDGYGAISVSPSAVRNVIAYVNHQPEHHARHSFENEYLAILDRAGVKYDLQYVFD